VEQLQRAGGSTTGSVLVALVVLSVVVISLVGLAAVYYRRKYIKEADPAYPTVT